MSSFVSGALLASTAGRTGIHIADDNAYIPGSYVLIQQRIIPLGKIFHFEQVNLSAPTTGTIRVKRNSDIIVISNTNPANLSFDLKLVSAIPMIAGEVLTVEFCARASTFAGSAYSFIHGYDT